MADEAIGTAETSRTAGGAGRADAARADERVRHVSLATRIMRRPELGAVAGLVLVTLFFVAVANPTMFSLAGIMNFMAPAAQLGILAVAAALLMVGGEFDLSVGSMVAFTGLAFGALVVADVALPLAILFTLTFAAVMGLVNGQIVLRTRLPSAAALWKEPQASARTCVSGGRVEGRLPQACQGGHA